MKLLVSKYEWLKYYLWTKGNGLINKEGREEENYTEMTQDFTTDKIKKLELEEDLKYMKNRKAPVV